MGHHRFVACARCAGVDRLDGRAARDGHRAAGPRSDRRNPGRPAQGELHRLAVRSGRPRAGARLEAASPLANSSWRGWAPCSSRRGCRRSRMLCRRRDASGGRRATGPGFSSRPPRPRLGTAARAVAPSPTRYRNTRRTARPEPGTTPSACQIRVSSRRAPATDADPVSLPERACAGMSLEPRAPNRGREHRAMAGSPSVRAGFAQGRALYPGTFGAIRIRHLPRFSPRYSPAIEPGACSSPSRMSSR